MIDSPTIDHASVWTLIWSRLIRRVFASIASRLMTNGSIDEPTSFDGQETTTANSSLPMNEELLGKLMRPRGTTNLKAVFVYHVLCQWFATWPTRVRRKPCNCVTWVLWAVATCGYLWVLMILQLEAAAMEPHCQVIRDGRVEGLATIDSGSPFYIDSLRELAVFPRLRRYKY